MIGMFFGVEQYIKAKDERLRTEIYRKINDIFSERDQYVDIAYSGREVGYEKVSIPSYWKEIWKEDFGNLKSIYRTYYKKSDWDTPFGYKDGWNLVVLKSDGEGVYQKWIFPYAVGYIKQKESWLNSYAPSVPEAVKEAFEFYTTDEESQYYGTFEKGCFNQVWSKIYDANNEYYHMSEDKHPRFTTMAIEPLLPLPDSTANNLRPYRAGYMYNGFYKVFIASTQPKTYTIEKYVWNPDEQEKKELWLYWSIGLTVLMLVIIIPLAFIEMKHNREKEEGLYDKLKRLCNPSNFINSSNYDKIKVDKANEIYKRILETTPDDKEALDKIQVLAVSELGISLINKDKLNELKEIVNPKNYMTPYNPDKVALANELFAILNKEGLTYNEMADVEEKAKQL